MADMQIIVVTILSSGVISAVVSGLFNWSSKDNEWRNHLSEDKKILRDLIG